MNHLSLSLSLSVFADYADSRASNKSVAGSSPQLSGGMLPNTSLDAMATDGKSRRPPPTPPLDDGKATISFINVHKVTIGGKIP